MSKKLEDLENLFKVKSELKALLDNLRLSNFIYDIGGIELHQLVMGGLQKEYESMTRRIEKTLNDSGAPLDDGTQHIIFCRVVDDISICETEKNPLENLKNLIQKETDRYLEENEP